MATSIGNSETLPQIVIGRKRGNGAENQGQYKDLPLSKRLVLEGMTPHQMRNKSAIMGPIAAREAGEAAEARGDGFWGADGFTFGDLIDIINPLQHIPVVNTVYRALTGDQISTGAKLAGGVLLGGGLGLVASAVEVVHKGATGKTMTESVVAALAGSDNAPAQTVAQNAPQGITKPQPEAKKVLTASDPVGDVDGALLALEQQKAAEKAEELAALDNAQKGLSNESFLSLYQQGNAQGKVEEVLKTYDKASQSYQKTMAMDKYTAATLGAF